MKDVKVNSALLLIRMMVGFVFIFEGIQKFLFPDVLGVASIPLVIIMLVAIISTKIPILINDGFWKMAHEARTDWAMLLGSIFFLIIGAGKWSLDSILHNKKSKNENN